MKERETLKAVASYAIFTWMLKLNVYIIRSTDTIHIAADTRAATINLPLALVMLLPAL